MKSKILFKIGSVLCLIFFFLLVFLMIFVLMNSLSRILIPDSGFTESFGQFQPIFAYFTIGFYQQPALYKDRGFITLNFISMLTTTLTPLFASWFMYKFLKNIHQYSLFMYENVSILFKLGVTIGVLGSASIYTENLMLSKVLEVLTITNAQIIFSNLSYIGVILNGIVLVIIALALKTAVHAVEENRKTI